MKIKTIEDARRYVLAVQICTVFPSDKVDHPSLYENVDLPEKQPGESGWGARIEAVWPWKNQLPADYPDEIFYGKIQGGIAVLMEMGYLADTHFPANHRPVDMLDELAQRIFEQVGVEPWTTADLRNEIMNETGCTKSRFDTALKNLQISLNIVRANGVEQDTWLTFEEAYAEIWSRPRTNH